jgi:hypothetical protein
MGNTSHNTATQWLSAAAAIALTPAAASGAAELSPMLAQGMAAQPLNTAGAVAIGMPPGLALFVWGVVLLSAVSCLWLLILVLRDRRKERSAPAEELEASALEDQAADTGPALSLRACWPLGGGAAGAVHPLRSYRVHRGLRPVGPVGPIGPIRVPHASWLGRMLGR